jgi:hypothetical protein
MTVKFKCKHTGQVYEFQDYDAEEMRKHSEYEEVIEQEEKTEEKPKSKAKGK